MIRNNNNWVEHYLCNSKKVDRQKFNKRWSDIQNVIFLCLNSVRVRDLSLRGKIHESERWKIHWHSWGTIHAMVKEAPINRQIFGKKNRFFWNKRKY